MLFLLNQDFWNNWIFLIQISKNSSFLYLLHFYSRCNAGFTGKHCNLTCAKGFYGVNCIKQCQCENSGICSRVNGSCSCTAGWFGTNCDYTCDLGNYGPNCANNCSCVHGTCDRFNGKCTCFDEYQGSNCAQSKNIFLYKVKLIPGR